ncbi:hypothetical protein INR49_018936, partial [Caranx melampygus]
MSVGCLALNGRSRSLLSSSSSPVAPPPPSFAPLPPEPPPGAAPAAAAAADCRCFCPPPARLLPLPLLPLPPPPPLFPRLPAEVEAPAGFLGASWTTSGSDSPPVSSLEDGRRGVDGCTLPTDQPTLLLPLLLLLHGGLSPSLRGAVCRNGSAHTLLPLPLYGACAPPPLHRSSEVRSPDPRHQGVVELKLGRTGAQSGYESREKRGTPHVATANRTAKTTALGGLDTGNRKEKDVHRVVGMRTYRGLTGERMGRKMVIVATLLATSVTVVTMMQATAIVAKTGRSPR